MTPDRPARLLVGSATTLPYCERRPLTRPQRRGRTSGHPCWHRWGCSRAIQQIAAPEWPRAARAHPAMRQTPPRPCGALHVTPVGWWTDYAFDFFMSWPSGRKHTPRYSIFLVRFLGHELSSLYFSGSRNLLYHWTSRADNAIIEVLRPWLHWQQWPRAFAHDPRRTRCALGNTPDVFDVLRNHTRFR